MTTLSRRYRVEVYDQDGTSPLRTLTGDRPLDSSLLCLKNSPTFTARTDGGYGELVLDLKAPFDDFEEGTTVNFMNVVKVYAVVRDESALAQSETLIYTGFMSRYEPYLQGGEEGVRVTCLGLVSLLTLS